MLQHSALWKREHLLQLTWEKLGSSLEDLRRQIIRSDFNPSSIVGICRGGLIPATFLSHAFGNPSFTVLSIVRNLNDEKYSERAAPKFGWMAPDSSRIRDQNVLVVDDIAGDGGTLTLAREILMEMKPAAIRTAVIVKNVNSRFPPDHFALEVDDWVVFPWELPVPGAEYKIAVL